MVITHLTGGKPHLRQLPGAREATDLRAPTTDILTLTHMGDSHPDQRNFSLPQRPFPRTMTGQMHRLVDGYVVDVDGPASVDPSTAQCLSF